MKRFIYLLLLILVSCTQPSIIGEWKLQKVELEKGVNERWPAGFSYDFENKERLRSQLKKNFSNKKDVHQIDSVLEQAGRLGLVFRSDSSYQMMHRGIFSPISYGGWFSVKDIEDKWRLKNDSLYLTMKGNDYLGEMPFKVMYKVLDLDENQLQIQELGIQGQKMMVRGMVEIESKPSTIITFKRK